MSLCNRVAVTVPTTVYTSLTFGSDNIKIKTIKKHRIFIYLLFLKEQKLSN
jgi:hypothetical protein